MAGFERHVFVCTNSRPQGHPRGCCMSQDSGPLLEQLKMAIARSDLASRVRINNAGCLGQCEHGAVMVVYPDGVWYGFVKETDVEEIVQSHLINGEPVERLRLPDACINTPTCQHRGGGMRLGRL